MAKSKKWPKIGQIRKDKNGKVYVLLNKDVEITVDGEPLDLGKYRTVKTQDPRAQLDFLRDNGFIDEAEHESRLEFLDEKNVKYELVVPPPMDE